MVKKRVLLLIVPMFFALLVSSCSSDDNEHLTLYNDVCNVMLGRTGIIAITSGNGDYTVTPDDPSAITVTHNNNLVYVRGVRIGATALTIVDNSSGEEAKVTVNVTRKYMTLSMLWSAADVSFSNSQTDDGSIADQISDLSHIFREYAVVLVGDGTQGTLYIFRTMKHAREGTILYQGTYSFTSEDVYGTDGNLEAVVPYLNLNFTVLSTPVTAKYDASTSHVDVRTSVGEFFGFNWRATETEDPATEGSVLILTQDFLDQFRPDYPNLVTASWILYGEPSTDAYVLPPSMVM